MKKPEKKRSAFRERIEESFMIWAIFLIAGAIFAILYS
jgi:hypothetical protein